jgi:hypothetical protein
METVESLKSDGWVEYQPSIEDTTREQGYVFLYKMEGTTLKFNAIALNPPNSNLTLTLPSSS